MLTFAQNLGNSVVERDNSNGENDNTHRGNDNSREKMWQHPLTTAVGKIKMYDNSKKPGTDLFFEDGSGRFFIPGRLWIRLDFSGFQSDL